MFKGFYDENIMAHGTAVRSLNSTRKNKGLLAVSTSSVFCQMSCGGDVGSEGRHKLCKDPCSGFPDLLGC